MGSNHAECWAMTDPIILIPQTFAKIDRFLRPPSWPNVRASADSDAANLAKTAVALLIRRGFSQTDAFLGDGGEIRVTAYAEDVYIELTFENDGTVSLIREDGARESLNIDGLSVLSVIRWLLTQNTKPWDLSESSIHISSIELKEDFRASSSGHPKMEAAFRSLMRRASQPTATLSAIISPSDTEGTPKRPLFTGASNIAVFPVEQAWLKSPHLMTPVIAT